MKIKSQQELLEEVAYGIKNPEELVKYLIEIQHLARRYAVTINEISLHKTWLKENEPTCERLIGMKIV